MEQAITLGAYAGTVVLPLAKEYGDDQTHDLIAGLVRELWAGLPLVYDVSDVDDEIGRRAHEDTTTSRGCPDGGEIPETPEDLVPDMLDMARTLWQLANSGTAEELALVARFRLSEIAAALDHGYALQHGLEQAARPGTFEAVVRECLEIVSQQRAPGALRALGDEDLYDHGISIGEHLARCIARGERCRLLTKPQVDVLALQVAALLAASGFAVVRGDEGQHPGVRVEIVDDIDLSHRHVTITWHPGETLSSRCAAAVNSGDYEAEALRRSGTVRAVMGGSLLHLLRAAGFEAEADGELGFHQVLVTRLNEPSDFASFVGSQA